jgi:hypothetical protein
MKMIRNVSVLSVAALVLGSFAATGAFADHGYHHGGGYHHGSGGYGDGYGDGFASALLSSYSLLTSADDNPYEADTLLQSAAIYEADGTSTPVFESFVGAMSEQMTAQLGADKMSQLDSDTLHYMVAEQILKDAQ